MSLISDALKKARQEAARQDSYRQGLPYAVGTADSRAPRAPWISLLAGLGAGCLLAAAVFAMAFLAGWGPFHKPVADSRVAAAPAPAVPAPQPGTAPPSQPGEPAAPAVTPPSLAKPVAVETPAPKPAPAPPAREPEAVRPAPQAPAPLPAAPKPAPETPAAAASPAPQPVVETPAPAPVEAAPAPALPSASAPAEASTYSGELPVPGGGAVKLNGIVYSPDHPIAVLDGRVMGPGESVQGFTVVAIESGRVKLQGHGMTVYLSPR
jgi:hypothetical protein